MSTLIVYASTHGCTEKCVQQLKSSLEDSDVLTVNIKTQSRPELCSFDTVMVGGSIHAGGIQRKIKKFCLNNEAILLKKQLGLFLCCLEEGDTAQRQFDEAFPASLRQHASATALFGGAVDFKRLNFILKSIMKKAGVSQSIEKINSGAIGSFASSFNRL